MTAKIYATPKEVKVPELNFKNFNRKKYEEDLEKFYEELKQFCIKYYGDKKNTGEIIRFQVGDGYAEYMVISMKPLELIHLPVGDEWHFEFAHLLTAKEVEKRIQSAKALNKIFSNK